MLALAHECPPGHGHMVMAAAPRSGAAQNKHPLHQTQAAPGPGKGSVRAIASQKDMARFDSLYPIYADEKRVCMATLASTLAQTPNPEPFWVPATSRL